MSEEYASVKLATTLAGANGKDVRIKTDILDPDGKRWQARSI